MVLRGHRTAERKYATFKLLLASRGIVANRNNQIGLVNGLVNPIPLRQRGRAHIQIGAGRLSEIPAPPLLPWSFGAEIKTIARKRRRVPRNRTPGNEVAAIRSPLDREPNG